VTPVSTTTSKPSGGSVESSKADHSGNASTELSPDALIARFSHIKPIAVSVFIALCSIVTAYHRVFSDQNFTSYDDEGTLMTIIKRFLEGHTLYDEIVVYYGPLYYFYEWCAHVLTGIPVSHDSVRFVSMFFWVVCALSVFLLVYRATDSLLLAAVAHFLSFNALGFIGREPAHPQELCVTLLVGLGLAACTIPNRVGLMTALGALAGAMAATKINLGVFAVIALGLALLFALRRGWLRSILLITAGLTALAFPIVLMWGHHTDWWAEKYCFVAVVSLGGAMLAISREEFENPVDFRDFLSAGAGFAVSVALIGWFAVMHGSSVHGMIDSLILQPQKSFGKSWFLEAQIPNFAIPWALLGLACAALSVTKRAADRTLASLKLAFAVIVGILSVVGFYGAMMSFVPPFIWLVAVRPGKTLPGRIGTFPRALLALMTVIQILYAYPVAGSQVHFTAVTIIALAAICLSDSLPFLNARSAARLQTRTMPHSGVPWPAMALTVLYVFSAVWAIQDYEGAEPLGLPGTGLMRIDHKSAGLVRSLVGKIDSSSCTMLASAPGLLSLSFLTGKPAPRDIDFSAWMLMLSDADQQKAITELSGERHPCVLYNQSLIDFWTHGADVSSRPLIRYIKENFEVVFEASGYDFMEPKRQALK
jgi:hypothetical protein